MFFLIIIVTSLFLAGSSDEQKNLIREEKGDQQILVDRALYLLHRNNPVEAHTILTRLEGTTLENKESKILVEVTRLLCQASLLEQGEDLNGAEKLMQQASTVLKTASGEYWKKITIILIHRSSLLYELKRPHDAEIALTDALAAARKAEEGGARLESLVLKKKNQMLQKSKNYEDKLRQAIEVYEDQLGSDHIYVGRGFYHLALLMEEKGRYEEAHKYYLKGMKNHEKHLGRRHPVIATFLTHMATMLRKKGEFKQAKIYLQKAIEIYDVTLRETGPARIQALKTMVQGREVDLTPITDRLIRFEEKNFGPDHPNVARSLRYFAMLYEVDRRHDKAEPMIKRALEIYEKAFPPENKEVLFTRKRMSACLFVQGKVEEAIDVAQVTLKVEQEKFGKNSPASMASAYDLATYFQKAGRFEDAETLFRMVLDSYQAGEDVNRDSLKMIATNLIEACLAQGKRQEAKKLRLLLQEQRPSTAKDEQGISKSCPRGYR